MRTFLQAANSLFEITVSLTRYVGFACFGVMAGLMTVGTVLRYVFNKPFVFTEEIVTALMIPLACIGFAYVFQIEGHIRLDLVTRRLGPKLQEGFAIWRELITIVILAIMVPQFYQQVEICLSVDRRFVTIPSWPMWPLRLIVIVGLCLAILYLTKRVVERVWKIRSRALEK